MADSLASYINELWKQVSPVYGGPSEPAWDVIPNGTGYMVTEGSVPGQRVVHISVKAKADLLNGSTFARFALLHEWGHVFQSVATFESGGAEGDANHMANLALNLLNSPPPKTNPPPPIPPPTAPKQPTASTPPATIGLTFSHPKMSPDLVVPVKPNEISWSYGLNTANYPTYGGEVIQILSCYIEDMKVTGHIRNYRELENVYSWFIDYIQKATQGGHFNPIPVTMTYPHRGWQFQITPKAMPTFKYGRDVVAPEWTMTAAVVDPAQDDFKQAVMDQAAQSLVETEGKLKLFGTVTGDIGFVQDDPFRSPDAGNSQTNQKNLQQGGDRSDFNQVADFYNKLIPAYLQGDFSDLAADYSKPTFTQNPNPGVNKGVQDAKGVAKGNKP